MREKLIFLLLIMGSIFLIILLYSRFIGTKGLYIKEYSIKHAKLPTHFHGLKIVHLSDIHYGKFINENRLNEIVEKTNLLNPDIIVITGDLLEDPLADSEKKALATLLNSFDAKLGKYIIRGNHDIGFDYWEEIINLTDFINLEEKTELIYYQKDIPIIIQGMSSNLESEITPLNKIVGFYDIIEENPHLNNTYKILIMHEPDYIDKINATDFDLILAGHSHRGQLRLPIFGPLLLPKGALKYYDEHYLFENTEMYISSGIGNAHFNLRLFNRPSINFYRIIN